MKVGGKVWPNENQWDDFFARFITLRQHRPQKSGFKGDALHLMVRPALSFRSGGFSGLLHRGHPYCNKQHPKTWTAHCHTQHHYSTLNRTLNIALLESFCLQVATLLFAMIFTGPFVRTQHFTIITSSNSFLSSCIFFVLLFRSCLYGFPERRTQRTEGPGEWWAPCWHSHCSAHYGVWISWTFQPLGRVQIGKRSQLWTKDDWCFQIILVNLQSKSKHFYSLTKEFRDGLKLKPPICNVFGGKFHIFDPATSPQKKAFSEKSTPATPSGFFKGEFVKLLTASAKLEGQPVNPFSEGTSETDWLRWSLCFLPSLSCDLEIWYVKIWRSGFKKHANCGNCETTYFILCIFWVTFLCMDLDGGERLLIWPVGIFSRGHHQVPGSIGRSNQGLDTKGQVILYVIIFSVLVDIDRSMLCSQLWAIGILCVSLRWLAKASFYHSFLWRWTILRQRLLGKSETYWHCDI